jgi:RP/EB family microtubule-associated protein
VKCKMQDNLEFLQWCRKYWDSNYAGHEYDAVARRKGQGGEPPATIAPVGVSPRSNSRTGDYLITLLLSSLLSSSFFIR